jgi:hypothetical protein
MDLMSITLLIPLGITLTPTVQKLRLRDVVTCPKPHIWKMTGLGYLAVTLMFFSGTASQP